MCLRGAEEFAKAVQRVSIIRFFAQYRYRFIEAAARITRLRRVAIPVEYAQVNVIKRFANDR